MRWASNTSNPHWHNLCTASVVSPLRRCCAADQYPTSNTPDVTGFNEHVPANSPVSITKKPKPYRVPAAHSCVDAAMKLRASPTVYGTGNGR